MKCCMVASLMAGDVSLLIRNDKLQFRCLSLKDKEERKLARANSKGNSKGTKDDSEEKTKPQKNKRGKN